MSEETILRSSIFGGYKKNHVMQYVDSVLNENEKREKKLVEQVELLKRENKRIKAQIADKDNKHPQNSIENTPIPFPTICNYITENKENLTVRQEMELPEGTYLISKNKGVITLPEPLPIYQTKQKDFAYNSIAVTRERTSLTTTEKEITTEGKYDVFETSIMKKVKQVGEEEEGILSMKILELEEELLALKNLLETEKHEKLLLTTKLEYSKELFMQLYKSK